MMSNKNLVKRIIITVVLVLTLIFVAFITTGCNKSLVDITYTFNYAYIEMPDGSCVEGEVSSWLDYEDGDQIQITIDGVTYLTDTTRVILVKR